MQTITECRICKIDTLMLKSELLRKSLHFLIALAPVISWYSRPLALGLLAAGTVLYAFFEVLRKRGFNIPLVSKITSLASRPREKDRFVAGPVTLGAGAFLALFLFDAKSASAAIWALAAGDGLSSLAGRFLGRIRPGFLRGKSVEGSLVCFAAIFLTSYCVLENAPCALAAAFAGAVAEALPLHDFDNIVLPLVVGFVVSFGWRLI